MMKRSIWSGPSRSTADCCCHVRYPYVSTQPIFNSVMGLLLSLLLRQEFCAEVEGLVDAHELHEGLVVGHQHQPALEGAQGRRQRR